MSKQLASGQYGRARLVLSGEEQGKRHGHVIFPWSRDASGWGALRIPIGIVSNGAGPTALLTGANHGDELEGTVVLSDLYKRLDAATITGTIIIVPMLNYPAFKAGRRLSPIDGGNMNRAFRGRSDGTLTEQFAYFVEHELVERADAVLDIHSGGRTMMFHPFAVSHQLPSPEDTARAREALLAFGAPVGMVLEELDSEGMLDSAVERRGKLFLSTELGGGGSTSPATLAIASRGVHNFLVHIGILQGPLQTSNVQTRVMTNDANGYIECEKAGLVEYLVELGQMVLKGDMVARIHDTDRIDTPMTAVLAPVDGMLVGRLHGGIAETGDFLGLLAKDFSA